MKDTKGVYVGPLTHLLGKTALLQFRKKGWAAQFDQLDLSRTPSRYPSKTLRLDLSHHWHRFGKSDFRVAPLSTEAES